MSEHKLFPVRMTKTDMDTPDVQSFRCGDKPHELPLSDWLKKHTTAKIKMGWKIWLYRLTHQNGVLVGFGSLTNGNVDLTVAGSRQQFKVYEIPMLALHQDFWGKPIGVDREEKYSRQIVRHLQNEAKLAQLRGQREKDTLLVCASGGDRCPETL